VSTELDSATSELVRLSTRLRDMEEDNGNDSHSDTSLTTNLRQQVTKLEDDVAKHRSIARHSDAKIDSLETELAAAKRLIAARDRDAPKEKERRRREEEAMDNVRRQLDEMKLRLAERSSGGNDDLMTNNINISSGSDRKSTRLRELNMELEASLDEKNARVIDLERELKRVRREADDAIAAARAATDDARSPIGGSRGSKRASAAAMAVTNDALEEKVALLEVEKKALKFNIASLEAQLEEAAADGMISPTKLSSSRSRDALSSRLADLETQLVTQKASYAKLASQRSMVRPLPHLSFLQFNSTFHSSTLLSK
jgi:chromosome segregation ATPase